MDQTKKFLETYGKQTDYKDTDIPIDNCGFLSKHLPAPEVILCSDAPSGLVLVQYPIASVSFTEGGDFENDLRRYCRRIVSCQSGHLVSFRPVFTHAIWLWNTYGLSFLEAQPQQIFDHIAGVLEDIDRVFLAFASEKFRALDTATVMSVYEWTHVTAQRKEVWELSEYDHSVSALKPDNEFPESLVLGEPFAFVRRANPLILKRSSIHGEDIWHNHHGLTNRRQTLKLSASRMRHLHEARLFSNKFALAISSMHLSEPSADLVRVLLEFTSQMSSSLIARHLTIENHEGVRLEDVLTMIFREDGNLISDDLGHLAVYIEFPRSICPTVEEIKEVRSKNGWRPRSRAKGIPTQATETIERQKAIKDWLSDQEMVRGEY